MAVGARSVENQQHRLTASGISAPVGMKNPTGGDLSVMINSIVAAQSSHTFIISGNLDAELAKLLKVFKNKHGYPEVDIRTHVAVYSINLISVLTLLLNGLSLDILEKHDRSAWEKLRHIWRYTFAEDELPKFAYCFNVLRKDSGRIIEHRLSDISRQMLRSTDFAPYKAFRTHIALDEELDYSALGMFYGFDYNTVNLSLKRLNIPVRAWNAIKTIVEQPNLFASSILHEELNILDAIFKFATEENDEGAYIWIIASQKPNRSCQCCFI